MHVGDMTAAGFVGARLGTQSLLEAWLVDIAERRFDEVTAAHQPITVDGDDAVACATCLAAARVVLVVEREKGIDAGKASYLLDAVVVGASLVGVNPSVDMWRQ